MVDQIRFFAGAARVLEGKVDRRVHAGLHVVDPARAGRAGRPGRALELPDDDVGLEVRPGLAAGNTVVLKPSRHDSRVVVLDGREDAGHLPAGRLQPRLRRPRHRRRADRAPDPAARLHHRLDAGRHRRRHRGGRGPEAGPPRARRQGAGRRLRRRRHRGRGRGHLGRRLFNGGQDCTAATRVIAQEGFYDDFVGALTEGGKRHQDRLRRRRRGHPLRPDQQRQPARPHQRPRRPCSRARPGHHRRPPARATAASSTSRPSSPTSSRTTS